MPDIETRIYVKLTRPELEQALRNFCALKDDTKLDGFWVDGACLASPQPVCGFSYAYASGIEARQGGDACGSVHESPVAKPDAQSLPGDHP